VSDSLTYTATLDMQRESVEFFSALLQAERRRRRTRNGTRALGPFRQAILVIRRLLDNTRIAQLACDNKVSIKTCYRYLDEGVAVLKAKAPTLEQVLEQAKKDRLTHLNLDGTLIKTDRCSTPGPNGHDLWWSGKHKHHGGNIQVVSDPEGFPLWTSKVRPGREHDISCARTHDILEPLAKAAADGLVTLADLGYVKAPEAFRLPYKKPQAGTHTEAQRHYNALQSSIRARAEQANAQLKMRFRVLQNISRCPWKIGVIVAAALVLFHHENGRLL
jgi:hypothetical protein